MSSDFSRTTAALASDRRGKATAFLAAGLALMALWLVWLCTAKISLRVKSDRARIEAVSLVHPVNVEVAGRVRSSHLELGRSVERGDILVELDRDVAELELEEVLARVTGNLAVVQRMEQLRAAAEAVVEQLEVAGKTAVAETRARAGRAAVAARFSSLNARRWGELHDRGFAAELDALRNQADADAERSLARAEGLASKRVAADQLTTVKARQVDIEQLLADIAKRQVDLATDEVLVRKLRADIDRRTVRAPIDGWLGSVDPLAVGQVLSAGQRIGAVVPRGHLRIVAEIPAREALGRIREGQTAALMLDAYPWTQYGEIAGRVARVAMEPNDGRLRVEVRIDDGQTLAAPRIHGLEGTLTITVEEVAPLAVLLRSVGRWVGGKQGP